MATMNFQGKQYVIGQPGTPLHLEFIAPAVPPQHWKEVDVSRWAPERDYGRGYLKKSGLFVLMTASLHERKRWQHLSVSHRGGRLPNWKEMCEVKNAFCGPQLTAYQIHPPSDKYVSIHPFCLHLWCCLDGPVTPDFTGGGETI